MTTPVLAAESVAIVMRGTLDPRDFAPERLRESQLVSQTDISAAPQRFSNDDTSILETTWFRLVANRELFQIITQEPDEFERVRDIALGLLNSISNLKLSVMGINRDVHLSVPDRNAMHVIGDTITPKEIWNDDILPLAGMSSLTLIGGRSDLYVGYQQLVIQPSNVIFPGVFIAHNDHYTLERGEAPSKNRDQPSEIQRASADASAAKVEMAIEVLNDEWQKSMKRALDAVARIWELSPQ
jgi:hypothetical protein